MEFLQITTTTKNLVKSPTLASGPFSRQEKSLLKKDLEAEKRKNELCLLEIEKLQRELDQWKEIVRDDMDVGVGFLRIENEDLKDELQENQ